MDITKTDRNINKLSDNFKLKVIDFLKEVGDIIFVTEGFRSELRQQELYSQGRTRPGNKVTWVKYSNHQDGSAIDIAFKGDNLYPNDNEKWKKIGQVSNKYGIDWGYDLWNRDKPHFQDNGEPYIDKNEPMNKFGPNITIDGITFPGTVYGTTIKLAPVDFKNKAMAYIKGLNTKKETYIIINRQCKNWTQEELERSLTHEVIGHVFYHTYYTEAQKRFWSDLHNYADGNEYFVSPYSIPKEGDKRNLRNECEHQAETLAFGYVYIKESKELPEGIIWNDKIAFQFDILEKFTKAVIRKHFT